MSTPKTGLTYKTFHQISVRDFQRFLRQEAMVPKIIS
jgi:hypothetical protein